MLADLHQRLHTIRAPVTLEQPFGGGVQLLHLDLQPENVVLSQHWGPVVLDWEWAAAGPPAADVAHTWLELATSEIPGPAWRRTMGALLRDAFLRTFLRHVDRAEAENIMPLVREYRLARRELTAHERHAIEAMR
jgi:thiamine kinase-like enzyme